jgi:hypothetical protein
VRPLSGGSGLRALAWHDLTTRLGLTLPFFLVHDIGMIFAAPREQYVVGPRADLSRDPRLGAALADYAATLAELSEAEAVRRARQLRLSDELVATILARLLAVVSSRITARPTYVPAVPFDTSLFERIDPQLAALHAVTDRSFEVAALATLSSVRLFVLTLADAIDTDTLTLFGLLGADAGEGPLAQVDLLQTFQSPEANDIVNFSLEILPSVLESRPRPAAGTTAAFGYSGVGNRGSVDSMVLSELAWDNEELARRIADNELLYYAREQSHEEQRRIHLLVVDASASMRGDRQTFARGVALATGKKLLLEGEEVIYRFFDSRLYEPARAKNGQLPTAFLLSFKGERGRNPARVFASLASDLELLRSRDPRSVLVHIFTHAALYIPKDLVLRLKQSANVAAVFILPSGGNLDLPYLDELDAYWVVDHETLSKKDARNDAARTILGDSETLRRDLAHAGPESHRRPDHHADAPPLSRRSIPPPSVGRRGEP